MVMKRKRTTKSATSRKMTSTAKRAKKRVVKAASPAIKRLGPVSVSSNRHIATAKRQRYHAPRRTAHATARSHIGSVIKGIILFLGIVLLLAILASIFMPSARNYIPDSLNPNGTMHHRQNLQPSHRMAPRTLNRTYMVPDTNTQNSQH